MGAAAIMKILKFNAWNVVLHRKQMMIDQQQRKASTWAPFDDSNPENESNLMQKMKISITKLEKSDFYSNFLQQIQTDPQFLYQFSSVLGSELKMQMVIYGIGNIDKNESSRLQLALAILMKRNFDWIREIEVFDPRMTKTEIRVLGVLGCSVLYVNENGRRKALKPTIFFMPHCNIWLYDHLLEVNWNVKCLNRMVVLGNSFLNYAEGLDLSDSSMAFLHSIKHVLGCRRLSTEIGIKRGLHDFGKAFKSLSWHFFKFDSKKEPQLKQLLHITV